MNRRVTVALALAAAIAVPAHAQHSMKPGLWEINNKMHSADGKMEKAMEQMQKQMAAMPPEQRKMMEDMMAKHGTSMPGMGAGGIVVKMCVTREMAARSEVPMQQNGRCKSTHTPMVAGSMKMSFTCTNPASSGDGQITFASDSAYDMNMNITTSATATPQSMSMEMHGKWLASECGDIKPFAMPPVK